MEIIYIKKKQSYENLFSRKLNVAAYVRVSTKRDLQLNSFESQINYYTDVINKNENWKLYKIYSDYGKSGTSTKNRTEFRNMINDAMKGKLDLIITKSVSRFARNTEDLLKAVRELKYKGVGIYFEEENINTLDLDGEFLLTVLATVAQTEAENTKNHINLALQHKMERGLIGTKARILGYKYEGEKLKIIKKEAKIVEAIFEMYLNEIKINDICHYLNSNRMLTVNKHKWSATYIYNILHNSIYTGDLIQGRTKNTKMTNYYIVRNHHPAIIDKEIYEKVQEKMKEKNASKKSHDHLKNILCGTCGRKLLYIEIATAHYTNLVCSNKKCHLSSIKKEVLEKIFIEFLYRIINLETNDNKYKNEIIKNENMIKHYQYKKIILLNDFLDYKINTYKYRKELEMLDEKINESQKIIDINNRDKLLNTKGKQIKDEILELIVKNTDDINVFNNKLFSEILDFTLIKDIKKRNKKVIKEIGFYYSNTRDLFDNKIRNYLDYSKEYELLFEFETEYEMVDRGNKLVKRKYVIKFYIRKD